jgi:hypothetical protein
VQSTVKARLTAAFTEWERRYREDPEGFLSDQQRLAETEETLGEQRAAYLMELLDGIPHV